MASGTASPRGLGLGLRQHTRAAHQQIERHSPLAGWVAGDYSAAEHRQYLQRALSFYRPLELELLGHPIWQQCDFDIEERQKVGLIEADLRTLGGDPSSVVDWTELPGLKSHEEVLGCLYVLEGSTLGGRLIMRAISKHIAAATEHRCFFNPYGSQAALRWKDFQQLLSCWQSLLCHQSVYAAANRTFNCLERCTTLDLIYRSTEACDEYSRPGSLGAISP